MSEFKDTEISKAILKSYYEKLSDRIESDVIIVGAGPAGLIAAHSLADSGLKVTVLEKRLSPGGGIWGGGMARNEVVFQTEVLGILDEFGIRHKPTGGKLHTVDAIELACTLCLKALHAGAVMLNLITAEDVCVFDRRVMGIVANMTTITDVLPVDPIMFSAKAVIDATGHEAALFEHLRKRGLWQRPGDPDHFGDGPLHAVSGEQFVVENTAELFPSLWAAGMSVCATLGGARMGPIFGGMLLSGKRAAEQIKAELG